MKRLQSLLFIFCLTPFFIWANVVEIAGYQFVAPDDWKQSEPTSPMRKAQFDLTSEDGKTAQLVFFYFGPSGGGGVRANIDRWMKQFKDMQDQKIKEEIVNEVKVTYARATGTFLSGSPFGPKTPEPGHSLLGSIVEGRQGSIFLKLVGPTNTVKAYDQSVIEMIKQTLGK
jgi:hypothetical protein